MNLKNSAEEMLNAELSSASFSSSQQNVQLSTSSPQWTSSSSTTPLAQTPHRPSSPAHNKTNFFNSLPTLYNDMHSTGEGAFSSLTANQTAAGGGQPTNSSGYFSNSNLINLNQESHPTNLQLNDQSKVFANSQFPSHYYNNHPLASQPILNNSLINPSLVGNSIVNNSLTNYEFANDLSTNGQKAYLDQHGLPHVVTQTTNNFHHYNISLHHANNTNHALSTEPSSLNFHHLQSLENNLLEPSPNSCLLNSSATSVLPLNAKKRKKDHPAAPNSTISKSSEATGKTLTVLKNSIKKEPTNRPLDNQAKEDGKQPLSRSLDLIDSYANYEYFGGGEHSNENNSNYSSTFLDSVFQSIKFYPFNQTAWHSLYDENFNKLPKPKFEVYADKGFNFSTIDDVFICQKKNHFQITVHIHPIKFNNEQAKLSKYSPNNLSNERFVYIKLKTENEQYEFRKVINFYLNFYGVKMESTNQTIAVEQSQSDRSKKPFLPIKVNFLNGQICKNTIGRLHFAETTSGNMRKKGRPNPDQKYFFLVASCTAQIENSDKSYPIVSHASERIIVRASNPGQFEMDAESCWQRSQFVSDGIYHNGKVGIGLDDPDESLVVYGNLKLTGTLIQPSDCRIKENIQPINTNSSLTTIAKINLYSFNYKDSYARNCRKDGGSNGDSNGDSNGELEKKEVGVLAQELQKILPDAVKNCGQFRLNETESLDNFLVINKDRLLFESVGAIQQLNSITNDLKRRLERFENAMNKDGLLNDAKFQNGSSLSMKSLSYLFLLFVLIMLLTVGFLELIKL